jgi:hypothetical protein
VIGLAEADEDIPKINPSEVESLIEKIWQNKLEEQDKRKIDILLRMIISAVVLAKTLTISIVASSVQKRSFASPAFPNTVFAHFPLAFAINFDSYRINYQME